MGGPRGLGPSRFSHPARSSGTGLVAQSRIVRDCPREVLLVSHSPRSLLYFKSPCLSIHQNKKAAPTFVGAAFLFRKMG